MKLSKGKLRKLILKELSLLSEGTEEKAKEYVRKHKEITDTMEGRERMRAKSALSDEYAVLHHQQSGNDHTVVFEDGTEIKFTLINESRDDDYSDREHDRRKDVRAMGFNPDDMSSYYDEIEDEIWSSKPRKPATPDELERKKAQDAAMKRARARYSKIMGNPYIDDY